MHLEVIFYGAYSKEGNGAGVLLISPEVFGDSKLIIRQIKNRCQTKHPRLKYYINEVWDLI